MARTISVIIPAHNARPFLREALDSVMAQTRPPEQIIVVDDGSTDGTAEVARAWRAERRAWITLLQQPHRGPAAARNAGIRAAQTDLVALLDADDLFLPDHLERLERGFDLAPESVLCFADAEVFTASGVTRPSFLAGTRIATVPTERRSGDGLQVMAGSAFASLVWGSYIPTATTVFERSAALRAGLFDERLRMAEDRDFLLRLSRLGAFSYYPVVLARKREHGANHTGPGHELEFSRDQFQVLHKTASAASALRLTVDERIAVQQALADHVFGMQETVSQWGLRAYLATCLLLARHGVVWMLLRPWPLLRALAWPILHQRDLRQQKEAVLRVTSAPPPGASSRHVRADVSTGVPRTHRESEMNPAAREPLFPEVGVLALPYHRWNNSWMTPHHVLTRLARYFHVVWLEPAHHWREVAAIDRRPDAPEIAARLPKGFVRYVPEAWLPDIHRPDWLRRALFRSRVRRAWGHLDRAGCRTRVLHLWHPEFERALDDRRYHLSLYHIDDEYTFNADAPPVGVQEARVLRRVDQVFATSPLLMERKGGINAHMAFAPQGVDFQLYATGVKEPDDLAPIPHPRIGYTGHIKRQLDWLLLRNLARRHPEWSFVFVGPRKPLLETQEPLADELASMTNVHFLGLKTVEDLARYPQHFDVCIMPYAVDGYTNNIYPMKLHEYLASRRPVVGSRIRTLQDFRHVVSLAGNEEEWSIALAAALDPSAASSAATRARQETAHRYDWSEIIYGIAETICCRLGPEYLSRLERIDRSGAGLEELHFGENDEVGQGLQRAGL